MKRMLFLSVSLLGIVVFAFQYVVAEDAQGEKTTVVPLGQAAVLEVTDTVVMKDGTKQEGRVIAAGPKSVIMLVEEGDKVVEKTIPRDKISRIEHGKPKPKADYYETGGVDGKEKIVTPKDGSTPPKATPAPVASGSRSGNSPRPNVTTFTTSIRNTSSSRTSTTSTPKPTGLSSTARTDTILSELVKDKSFAGLIRAIGYTRTKQLVDLAKNGPHFAKMLENYNVKKQIVPADLAAVIKNTPITLDADTEKKLQDFLKQLTTEPQI